jgi:hypothetical protein
LPQKAHVPFYEKMAAYPLILDQSRANATAKSLYIERISLPVNDVVYQVVNAVTHPYPQTKATTNANNQKILWHTAR